jgi:two-component system, chemotaxis family, protein-glutamate methylesterase/glutaminase
MLTSLPHAQQQRPKSVADPIRVMLIDDSSVARAIFARMLADSDDAVVVAEAADSAGALRLLSRVQADVILLDIEMPQRSGLDALPDILAASKGARVIVVSSFIEENGAAAIEALSRGACDTMSKPGRSGFGGRFSDLLREKVVRLGRSSRTNSALHALEAQSPSQRHAERSTAAFELAPPNCIAIGASTGGIPIIYKLIKNLDPQMTCPIFIVQHLPHAFMDFFARQLATYTDRPVSVAAPGIEVLPGRIYIAPGDAHLKCKRMRNRIIIDHVAEYAQSRYCPSVDALFESVADVYGDAALALVLSGMGNDGTAGARKLHAKGATIVVQDASTCVVWGMPGAVARENLAHAVLTPDQLSLALKKAAAS